MRELAAGLACSHLTRGRLVPKTRAVLHQWTGFESPRPSSQGGLWERDGDDDVFRIECSDPREALSPGLLWAVGSLAALTALTAAIAGAHAWVVALLVLFVTGTALPLVYFMRLALGSRELRARSSQDAVELRDGGAEPMILPYGSLVRVVFVHDGAPARLLFQVGGQPRLRRVVGALYRHNTVECFVPEVPSRVVERFLAGGLRERIEVRRGIRTSAYRPFG